jgi:hypothetical protein
MRLIDRKPDLTELEGLRQDLNHKVGRHDFDMLQVNFSNFKLEAQTKLKNADKDIDDFIETMQNELNQLKNSMLTSLNKKADFSMLDRLNELVSKKVDQESIRTSLG